MIRYPRFLPLLTLALLAGCGSSRAPAPPATYPNLTGNWQIQSSNVSGGTPVAQVVLFGALQSSTASADVTGTFRFSNLAQPLNCALSQVVTLSGTVDGSGNLSLASPTTAGGLSVKTQLHPSATATGFDDGTIEVDGTACALASSPALGVQIAPVTGTFNGPLIPGALGSGSSAAGTASLVLTQASNPSADGQFPVTGSLSYAIGTCSGTAELGGDASGVGVILSAAVNAPGDEPAVSFVGTTNPAASQIQAGSLGFLSFSCTGDQPSARIYSGTFNRQ